MSEQVSRFFKSSCRPNLKLKFSLTAAGPLGLEFVATRRVEQGEEITWTYHAASGGSGNKAAASAAAGSRRSRRGRETAACLCGAEGCSGRLFV